MFLLPVGHDRAELRRWPVVSISLGVLCIAVFLVMQLLEGRAERRTMDAAREVFLYAGERPYLEIDDDLLFGDTAALATELAPGYSWSSPEEPADRSELRREQQELERLTELWRQADQAVPERAMGLVPAQLEAWNLLSHLFVHAGLFHLAANLFFFWLLAPPLEDVWGRPLFAVFYLVVGILAGLLWCQRYPNSTVPVVGASGAIAGLMGAFMVRFWNTRIRFVFFVMTLRIIPGSFTAPAWLMLGLWFLRELGMSTLFEPHASPVGGVATWGHIYGFGAGVAGAVGLRALRVEERWIRRGIQAATGELENPLLKEAFELEKEGNRERVWELLRQRLPSEPRNWDATLRFWDLSRALNREQHAAPYVARLIRHEITSGQIDLAWQHHRELSERLPEAEVPPAVEIALAEALVGRPGSRAAIANLLSSARQGLPTPPPPGLGVKLARVSALAGLPEGRALCARAAADPDLPEAVRRELAELARAEPPGPGGASSPRR